MTKKDKGYISLHRSIMDNPLYSAEPFCKNMAWIDLLLLANYKNGHYYIRGIPVMVPRGTVGWSIKTLAKRWRWSEGKTKRYLSHLKTVSQITMQKTNVTTLITIVNYELYQSVGTANRRANGAQTASQTNLNNKGNKDNKGKPPFATATAPRLRKIDDMP